MTRVVKVLTAATKARWSGRRRRKAPTSGYTGPVNLPPEALPGIRAAMKKTNSYAWLDDACADDEGEQSVPVYPERIDIGCMGSSPEKLVVCWAGHSAFVASSQHDSGPCNRRKL